MTYLLLRAKVLKKIIESKRKKYHSPPLGYRGICYTLELYRIFSTSLSTGITNTKIILEMLLFQPKSLVLNNNNNTDSF
jgi:hypothetical protein